MTFISDINTSTPANTDSAGQTDDQIRQLKSDVLDSFPNISAAVTGTPADLNILTGQAVYGLTSSDLNKIADVSATATEINLLDGLPGTLTTTEIGYLDGVTSSIQTQINAIPTAYSSTPFVVGVATANNHAIRKETFDAGQIPIGATIDWWGDLIDIPSNYAYPTGQAISRTTYSALFALFGTRYGSGDGITTFNLPDLRGVFERNVDAGAGVDPDAATRTDRGDGTTGDVVGTKQNAQNEAHDHGGGDHNHRVIEEYSGTTGVSRLVLAGTLDSGVSADYQNSNGSDQYIEDSGTIITSQGGNEARPVNIYKYAIMRLI